MVWLLRACLPGVLSLLDVGVCRSLHGRGDRASAGFPLADGDRRGAERGVRAALLAPAQPPGQRGEDGQSGVLCCVFTPRGFGGIEDKSALKTGPKKKKPQMKSGEF